MCGHREVGDHRSARTCKEAPMTTTTDRPRRHTTHGTARAAAGLALGISLGLTGCTAHTRLNASKTTTATTSAQGASTGAPGGAPTTIAGAESDIVLSGRHFRALCD